MTTLHEQGAFFGDPIPVQTPAGDLARRTNDVDLIASVIGAAVDPGYVLIGRSDKPYGRDPATPGRVEPVPGYERDVVAQLLDSGHLTIGGTRHVTCGRRDGPARSVLVPRATRAMAQRWSALHPLRATTPARKPDAVTVHVDVVAPGRGLVTCGAADWSGSITRQDDRRYWAETEDGHVVARARSYRDGAQRLARHHGHTTASVVVDFERDDLADQEGPR